MCRPRTSCCFKDTPFSESPKGYEVGAEETCNDTQLLFAGRASCSRHGRSGKAYFLTLGLVETSINRKRRILYRVHRIASIAAISGASTPFQDRRF